MGNMKILKKIIIIAFCVRETEGVQHFCRMLNL